MNQNAYKKKLFIALMLILFSSFLFNIFAATNALAKSGAWNWVVVRNRGNADRVNADIERVIVTP